MAPDTNLAAKKKSPGKPSRASCSIRFEAAKTDSLFGVLDGVAWLGKPNVSEVAQFADVDPRTAGKLLKNCVTIGLLGVSGNDTFALLLPYPHKGTAAEKRGVVREALIRMPLLESVRQFIQLGDSPATGLRKAASVLRVENFDHGALSPLLDWATQFDALTPGIDSEGLLDQAVLDKAQRHKIDAASKVVFLSHSSADKPFVRKLATDLTSHGVKVWLDEWNIRVGESIPESIARGAAQSDYFVLVVSQNSAKSEWVKHELNTTLMREIPGRNVVVLPVKIDDVEVPAAIRDKHYADFTGSYKQGLTKLLEAINYEPEHGNG